MTIAQMLVLMAAVYMAPKASTKFVDYLVPILCCAAIIAAVLEKP